MLSTNLYSTTHYTAQHCYPPTLLPPVPLPLTPIFFIGGPPYTPPTAAPPPLPLAQSLKKYWTPCRRPPPYPLYRVNFFYPNFFIPPTPCRVKNNNNNKLVQICGKTLIISLQAANIDSRLCFSSSSFITFSPSKFNIKK